MSWMKKHARDLLSTMPIDNRASALQKHGKPHAKDEFGMEIPTDLGFTQDKVSGGVKSTLGGGKGATGEMKTITTGYQSKGFQPTFNDGNNVPKKGGDTVGDDGSRVLSTTGEGSKTRQKVRKLFTKNT